MHMKKTLTIILLIFTCSAFGQNSKSKHHSKTAHKSSHKTAHKAPHTPAKSKNPAQHGTHTSHSTSATPKKPLKHSNDAVQNQLKPANAPTNKYRDARITG